MSSAFIISARRTPVGAFQGTLGAVPAPRLGAVAIAAALADARVPADAVDQCIMGEVLTAGVGQAPARQAALYAGLPNTVPCLTINKVCGSGLKAVMIAADDVALGHADVVVAGGQESMTLAPHLLENSRAGYRMGPVTAVDSMVKDGLWDPYSNIHMGSAAELCVKKYEFSREAQDAFAIDSYKKAQAAIASGFFRAEIAPVEIKGKGESTFIDVDEGPGKARFDKMPGLKPAFEKDGTITAANASSINDGGAAVVVASEAAVRTRGLTPLARIVAHGTYAHEPKWFTTAPVTAINRALARAQLKIDDIDLFEINEAFAVVPMACARELHVPMEKINVHGGAIALGHPIGASGARILTTLIHALGERKKRYGLATLCIGGGEGVAMIVERL